MPNSQLPTPNSLGKYLWYAFLGLFSLGFVCLVGGVMAVMLIIGHYSQDLPDYKQLADYTPSVVTRLYAGDGKLMAEYAKQKRVFVPESSIPEKVKNAFIAAEDQNFYTHPGVDYLAIARAALFNVKNFGSGRRPIGASTITQQVAKNFLLTNEVSYERKIKEAILAYRMEQALSKQELLELYLNEIYLGAGTYGVAAAGLHYFGKSLDELEIHEVGYLAALPKAPNNYHPVRKHDAAVGRRNWVIERMMEDGYITEGQAEISKLQPLTVADRGEFNTIDGSYFAEEVRRELLEHYGEQGLYKSGLVVRTSVDPKLQKMAVKALRDGLVAYDRRHGYRGAVATIDNMGNWQAALGEILPQEGQLEGWKLAVILKKNSGSANIGFADGSTAQIGGGSMTFGGSKLKVGSVIFAEESGEEGLYALRQVPEVQGALIAMDPQTGRVLAMQGGWKYEGSEFNRATQAKRQPGSAFKPFIYQAALDKGFTPATLIMDAPIEIEDRPGNIWSPSNYSNDFNGPTTLRKGIEKSKNLMTVRLANFIGMETISDYAEKFGVIKDMPPLLANSLGAGETTLMDITNGYAVFVNGGKKVAPSFIDRIQDRWGTTVLKMDERPCPDCGATIKWQGQKTPDVPDTRPQIVDPRTAYQMVSMLEGVVQRGTGIRLKSLGRPLAGKTGTTNESKDAWFVGFSPNLVVGVYVGFDEPKSLGERETGSSVAVPIFKDFMQAALEDEPVVPFRVPEGIRNVKINADTGARARLGDQNVIWDSFIAGTEPTSDVFILNDDGINVMSSSYLGDSVFMVGSDFEWGDENVGFNEEDVDQRPNITSGTGGLY